MVDPKPHTLEELFSIAETMAAVQRLEDKVDAQAAATKELVDAWKAARTTVTFVKWISSLVTALTILWVVVKHFVWPAS